MQQTVTSPRLNRRQLLALMPASAGMAFLPSFARATTKTDPVQALVEEFVASGKADGVSVAVVRDGATRFHQAGVVSRESKAPVTEHSVFEIGSISKTFTSLILAHAIRDGLAKLNDDVRKHLPTGYDNLVRDGRPVRLADMVTTTSALPDNIPDWMTELNHLPPAELPIAVAKLLDGFSKEQFLTQLSQVKLVDVPGKLPRHSNVASQVQGIVVERLYGQPYDALVARFIEKPLGMRPGGAVIPAVLKVTGYSRGRAMPLIDQPVIRAAGGLHYSAVDMARYLSAQIAATDPAIALTHQPVFGSDDAGHIGFHWVIGKTADSLTYLRHSGGTFGQSSYCDFYPAQRYGVVVLANSSGAQNTGQALADAIHGALFGPPRGLRALEAALESSDYADVPGTIAAIKARFPELFLHEDFVNRWGYRLLQDKRVAAARGIFAWNVAARPNSWNAHDSLAEALAESGDKAGAIAEYQRSLELNPANDNGKEMLAKLQKQP